MIRGMAVPTTVWSSELRNIASSTPASVMSTCRLGREWMPTRSAVISVLFSCSFATFYLYCGHWRVDRRTFLNPQNRIKIYDTTKLVKRLEC